MTLTILFFAFATTACALLALRPLAAKVGLLDIPGGRKTHKAPTPMIGGLGIYLGTLSICLLSPIMMPDYLTLLLVSGLVLAVGVLDDLYDMRVSLRMGLHAFAALIMCVMTGVSLSSLGSLFFGDPILLGMMAIPFTLFAVVGVVNAVNMSDGLDGLSGGLVVIALVMLSIVAISAGQSATLNFYQILIVSLLAFLAFNFRILWHKSALVYLGDAGSTLLGFIVAWLIIAATQGPDAFIAPVYALWFLAMPLMDTVSLMIRRPLQGRSPFHAGRDHLHHRLLAMGYDVRQTVLIIHTCAVVFGAIGLIGYFARVPEGLMFILFMLSFLVYFMASRRAVSPESEKLEFHSH